MQRMLNALYKNLQFVILHMFSLSLDSKVDPLETALPFDEIPEPKSLPLIGTLLDYTPFRGFHISKVHEHWERRHQEYGDIFKEKLDSNCTILIVDSFLILLFLC